MKLQNDNSCSWINDLNLRTNIKTITSNEESDWLIIGAGYTGLSAARKLGQLFPNQKILLIDADPQANATSGLGIDLNSIQLGTYQLLDQSVKIEAVSYTHLTLPTNREV